jgi:hypothetical protein
MIPISILSQPDDSTCGPTSLHAVYRYFNDPVPLEQVIAEVSSLEGGGTLAVMLANHALRRGYHATIYTYNLNLFDPSWFASHHNKKDFFIKKLNEQMQHKPIKKLEDASRAFIEFFSLGGRVQFKDLTPGLLKKFFKLRLPLLTGLSATYLYRSEREYTGAGNASVIDDVKGFPLGHFVVLCGYDEEQKMVVVADPYKENPVSHDHYYAVKVHRLMNAILLGIVTYDGNLLVIQPKKP